MNIDDKNTMLGGSTEKSNADCKQNKNESAYGGTAQRADHTATQRADHTATQCADHTADKYGNLVSEQRTAQTSDQAAVHATADHTADKYGEQVAERSVNKREKTPIKPCALIGNKLAERITDIAACAFIVVFISGLFAVLLKVNGVYPFGDDVISSYDMLAQVAPFIEHFFDVIDGKSSLFYTYAIAGGADVFGTLAYCCVSPFTFLFLLFGKGNVYYGTSIILPLKIACVGVSGYLYLRARFKKVSPIMRVSLALSYAFCGYLFVSNTYINWVDILIWLPIAAYGFKKMIDGGGRWVFILGLCLIIYTCFSIACFSLLLVYPIAILYCLIVLPKEKRQKGIVDLVVALVITVGISLPLLIPALFAFLSSGRGQGLFYGLFDEIKADPLYYKLSYIFTDGLTLTLTFVYFVKNGVKRPIDRFLVVSALITLLPVLCDECCIMLNFGTYYSYALRFGFLNGFFFLFVAGLYVDEFKPSDSTRCARSGKKVSMLRADGSFNVKIIWSVVLSVVCVGALIGGAFLCVAAQNDKIEKYFSSRFAHSLGGLEVTAIVFAIVAIIVLLTVILVKFKNIFPRVASVIMLVIVCGQCAFYGENLVYGNVKQTDDFDRIGVLTDYVQTLDGGDVARVKLYSDYVTADMPFTLHTNSYSVFSSVIDDRNFRAQRFFDYGGNGTNTIKSYNGSFFGDCLLGNEYYITKSAYAERNYEKVDGYDKISDGKGGYLDVGEYRLYKNVYAFPHAFVTGGVADFVSVDTLYDEYEAILKTLGGDEYGVESVEIKSSSVVEKEDGGFRISFTRTSGGGYYFFVLSPELANGAEYSLGSSDSRFEVGENRSFSCHKGSNNYSSAILYLNDDVEKSAVMEGVKLYRLADSTVKALSEAIKAKAADFELSAGKMTARAVASASGEYLFLNYVALPGHRASVNGKVVEIIDDCLGFMLIPLEKGENEVVVTYDSPYIKYAVFGLIAGLLIVFVCIFITKKRDLSLGKFGKVISFAALGLGVAIALVFMVFPVGVFIYKLAAFLLKKLIALF